MSVLACGKSPVIQRFGDMHNDVLHATSGDRSCTTLQTNNVQPVCWKMTYSVMASIILCRFGCRLSRAPDPPSGRLSHTNTHTQTPIHTVTDTYNMDNGNGFGNRDTERNEGAVVPASYPHLVVVYPKQHPHYGEYTIYSYWIGGGNSLSFNFVCGTPVVFQIQDEIFICASIYHNK